MCGMVVMWHDSGHMPVMSYGSGCVMVMVGVVMVVVMLECYCYGCGCGCGEVGGMGGGNRDSKVVWVTVGCTATWCMR